jgi:regulation of enolase protein 1 (concanavalin A-like superfamily)
MQKQYLWVLAGAMALSVGTRTPVHAAPPAGYTAVDIGSPDPAGSTDVDDKGVWTLKGAGSDIWGNADQFHYAYQKVKGDATITAQYLSMEPGDATWTKAGPMIRVNDTEGSAHAELVQTSASGAVLQGRLLGDDVSTNTGTTPLKIDEKAFLRVQRAGNDVAGFISRDGGKTWSAVGTPYTLTELQEEALVGLAITSHQDGTLATTQFDSVNIAAGAPLVYGLKGCGGDKAVMLEWKPVKGAESYNLYRAPAGETDVTKFVKVNTTAVAGNTFTDNTEGLVNNQSYTYLVSSLIKGADGTPVEGDRVAIQTGPVVLNPPTGFTNTSINEDSGGLLGTCSQLGASFIPETGEIVIRGSGADIWNAADEFNFTHQEVEGNFRVTVTALTRPSNTNEWAKAGLMIREGIDAGARDAYLVLSANQGLTFQWRDTTDGGAAWSDTRTVENADLKTPIMIRMTRTGDEIVGEYSTDEGKTWLGADAEGNKITLDALASKVNVGLAITSHQPGQISEARFKDLKIEKL